MELELGLALPTYHLKNGFEPTESVGSDKWSDVSCLETNKRVKTKRAFNNAFEEKGGLAAFPTLPLLSWSDQPNEEDDRNKAQKKRLTLTSIDSQANQLVGWPPIHSWRKKLLCERQGNQTGYNRPDENELARSNSMYVKVKMEGIAIGRKINLRLYHSYQTLTNTLISMFGISKEGEERVEDGADYRLTYQDKEGDWLLAGEVPWQTFIESVRRLEIQKNYG